MMNRVGGEIFMNFRGSNILRYGIQIGLVIFLAGVASLRLYEYFYMENAFTYFIGKLNIAIFIIVFIAALLQPWPDNDSYFRGNKLDFIANKILLGAVCFGFLFPVIWITIVRLSNLYSFFSSISNITIPIVLFEFVNAGLIVVWVLLRILILAQKKSK